MTDDDAKRQRSDIEEIRLLLKQLEEAAARETMSAHQTAQITAQESGTTSTTSLVNDPSTKPRITPTADYIGDPRTKLTALQLSPGTTGTMLERKKFEPPILKLENFPAPTRRKFGGLVTAGVATASIAGAIIYASVSHVPVLSQYVTEAQVIAASLVPSLKPAPDEKSAKPARPAAVAAALPVIADTDTAQSATATLNASMLTPISLPTQPPPVITVAAPKPATPTLAPEALPQLSMPKTAPIVVALKAGTQARPKSDDQEEPKLTTPTTTLPQSRPIAVAMQKAVVQPKQAVSLHCHPKIHLPQNVAVPLGLYTENTEQSGAFLLVARGVPKGVQLSKGSPIGKDSWFMPATGLESLSVRTTEPVKNSFTLKLELVTVDGRVVSTSETSVEPAAQNPASQKTIPYQRTVGSLRSSGNVTPDR